MHGRSAGGIAARIWLTIGMMFVSAAHAQVGYVVNLNDNTVNQIDASNNVVGATPLPVGHRPTAVAIDFAYAHYYVGNNDDHSISVFDPTVNRVVETIADVGVYGLVASSTSRLFAAENGYVTAIDTATNTVVGSPIALAAANSTGCPKFDGSSLAVNSAGTRLYVPTIDGCISADPFLESGEISVVDTQAGIALTAIPVGHYPSSATITRGGDRVYVTNWADSTISVIDTAANSVARVITLPANSYPQDGVIAGTRLYVSNNSGSVSIIDTLSDQLLDGDIAAGDGPMGIAATSDGRRVFVANQGSNTVSVIDTATNQVTATLPVGSNPVAIAITRDITGGPVNVDQHGLTGSWFDPDEGGQGIEIEVYPDVYHSGSELVAGGWFTYDTNAAGGRRWYGLTGTGLGIAGYFDVQIYDVEGGNLGTAPSVGVSNWLGDAFIFFGDCNTATLNYGFFDGRVGTIPLVRLTPNVTCSPSGDNGNPPSDYLLSGNWFDPQFSGQGFIFDFSPSIHNLFAAWYTFKPHGQQIGGAASQDWYTLQSGQFAPGTTSLSDIPIVQTSGGVFVNGTPPTSIQAGSADITLYSCALMTLKYRFTAGENSGLSGSMNLVRIGPTPSGCHLP
jgi:YVTN family beta-propeller protein